MILRAAILDDEPLAHRVIESYCKQVPTVHLIANYYTAAQAAEDLAKSKPDLLFLDLKMPKTSGFELLQLLPNPPIVIVCTAYHEHAVEGFDLEVCDYLLKPFSLERLLKAIKKAHQKKLQTSLGEAPVPAEEGKPSSIFIKQGKKHVQIAMSDILYIRSYGHFSKIFTATDTFVLASDSIGHFEETLPRSLFSRTHKGFLVNKAKITLVENSHVGINAVRIPIGDAYRRQLKEWLGLTVPPS
jgi:DNA-binding LytR/AlgR family response regulator